VAEGEAVHPGIIQVSFLASVVAALLRTQDLLYPGGHLATLAFSLSVASTIMLLISYVFRAAFVDTDAYTLGRFVRYTRQVGLLALFVGILSLYGSIPFWLY
jgi:hypothetical protein